ncbi:MAG: 2-oxo acid dehydrogenase subunit E2 [Myxococcales bacterium]|nr:2-oxo acid dehydrogenase subunit E2 [Myxococcales bacterium]
MATFEFKLPDLGEGVVEGEIVAWLVKPGDAVNEDQGLVELMTDKATVTVPSPRAGKVLKTYGAVGEMAKVHKPLVDLETAGGAAASAPAKSGNGHAAATSAPAPAAARATGAPPEKVLATPVTRRMAREHHLDLAQVPGTGPQGRVLKSDVEAFLSSGGPKGNAAGSTARPAQSWVPLSSTAGDQRIPIRGLRKKIAEKMVKSKFTAPHYAFVEEVDVSALVSLREVMNERLKPEGVKLSFLPFFVKAVSMAFRRFPQVNANMDEAAQELIVRGEQNLGIAAMTEQGLTVPVLRRADQRGLKDLSAEINRLANAARDQKLKLEELSGGTFTITSLGQTGGLFATPIINHPEVAIMGVHRMRKRPLVGENDQLVIRPVMNFSFCFDHRVIDGATGADFAYEVLRYVEQPGLLMLDLL